MMLDSLGRMKISEDEYREMLIRTLHATMYGHDMAGSNTGLHKKLIERMERNIERFKVLVDEVFGLVKDADDDSGREVYSLLKQRFAEWSEEEPQE